MKMFTILNVIRIQFPPASVEQEMPCTICLSGSLFSETICKTVGIYMYMMTSQEIEYGIQDGHRCRVLFIHNV